MKQIDNLMNIKPPRAEPNRVSPQTNRIGQGENGTAATGTEATSTEPRGDSFTLTAGASAIARLQENLASLPDVDNARVAQIRAAIEEGSYQIDTDKIVGNLLKVEKDLL
jgi:negative regulator of flagellin synthesis FlgM